MRTIATTWNFARWLRLGLATVFLFAGINGGEPVAYVLAALLGMQATFNVGCSCTSCDVNERSVPAASKEREITFEKIE